MTAVLATLGDLTTLLLVSGAGKMSLDLIICVSALSQRYGLHYPVESLKEPEKKNISTGGGSGQNKSSDHQHFGRKRRRKHKQKSRREDNAAAVGGAYGSSLSSLGGCGLQVRRHKRKHQKGTGGLQHFKKFLGMSSYKNMSDEPQGPLDDSDMLPNIIRGQSETARLAQDQFTDTEVR